MKSIVLILCICISFVSCSNLKKVEKVSGSSVPGSLSMTKIKSAIMEGGATKGWIITPTDTNNTLNGSLTVRTHKVEVEIPYSKESYDILYKSSENMKYDRSRDMIHRNYYRWVYNLRQAIDIKLALKANE